MSTVVAFAGARGGVGRSEIAVVFARSAAKAGHKAAVIDAHEGEGSAGMLLGIDPHDTHERLPAWAAAVADGPIGNEGLVARMVAQGVDGVALVRGASGFGWTLDNPVSMDRIVRSLEPVYEVIAIACPPVPTPAAFGAVRAAGSVVVVSAPATVGLYQTLQFLDLLREEKRPPRGLVVTCPHGERVGSAEPIADLLQCPVLGIAPFDRGLGGIGRPRDLDGAFGRAVRVALDPILPGIAPAARKVWWKRG